MAELERTRLLGHKDIYQVTTPVILYDLSFLEVFHRRLRDNFTLRPVACHVIR